MNGLIALKCFLNHTTGINATNNQLPHVVLTLKGRLTIVRATSQKSPSLSWEGFARQNDEVNNRTEKKMNQTKSLQSTGNSQAVSPMDPGLGILSPGHFVEAQRVAKALSESTLVPKDYRGNLANCLIALDMAQRLQANPLAIMQSLYIVHGKPSWSSTFIAGAINTCGRFDPVDYIIEGEGDDRGCFCRAKVKGTVQVVEGPRVSIGMAKAEGWMSRAGSKWQTMPELMLRYRAVTFFGRLYAPEILLGMQTDDEVIDVQATVSDVPSNVVPVGKIGAKVEAEQSPQEAQANEGQGDAPPVKPKRKRRTKEEMAAARKSEEQQQETEQEETGTEGQSELLPDNNQSEEEQQLRAILAEHGYDWSDFVYFMKVEQEYDVDEQGVSPKYLTSIIKTPDPLIAAIEALKSGA